MANAIYPEYKQAVLGGSSGDLDGGVHDLIASTVKCILWDQDDGAYNGAHTFVSDLTGTGIVARSAAFTSKTAANGTFDADNISFTSVSGDQCEALIIYIEDAAGDTESRLVCYLDNGITGMPVTPNGGDINVTWDAAGIFTI